MDSPDGKWTASVKDHNVFVRDKGSDKEVQLSTDGVEHLLKKHLATAKQQCPSLNKKHVTPHVLRHTTAMELLQCGVDRAVIALWLGHESVETTQMYLHADLKLKEKALAKTAPLGVPPGRYKPARIFRIPRARRPAPSGLGPHAP